MLTTVQLQEQYVSNKSKKVQLPDEGCELKTYDDDINDTCTCSDCWEHGWHGGAALITKRETYAYKMDSSLLNGTSRFGTMDLFSICREEYHPETEEVVWATLVFRIRCHWVYTRFVAPRIEKIKQAEKRRS